MRFYYENSMGNTGYFTEDNLARAIYISWNIKVNLYILNDGLEIIDWLEPFHEQAKLILAPFDTNKFNSNLLKEFGYKMIDDKEEREIVGIKTGEVVKFNWDEVIQLI